MMAVSSSVRQLTGMHFTLYLPLISVEMAQGPLSGGIAGVQQHDEGLADLLKLPDDPFLRLLIILPGNVRHGAVGG